MQVSRRIITNPINNRRIKTDFEMKQPKANILALLVLNQRIQWAMSNNFEFFFVCDVLIETQWMIMQMANTGPSVIKFTYVINKLQEKKFWCEKQLTKKIVCKSTELYIFYLLKEIVIHVHNFDYTGPKTYFIFLKVCCSD